MSEEQVGTLNTESAGEPSQPAAPQQSEDLIATVDQPIPEPVEEQEQAPPEEAQTTEGESEEEKEKEAPFHEHPRFQEIIREKNALKEQIAELQKAVQQPPSKGDAEEPDYKDMGGMTKEELQDMFDEDPKGFLTNFAKQVSQEVRADVLGQVEQRNSELQAKQEEDLVAKQYEEFGNKNPEFLKMWESGDIEKFMASNPGHTPMSAYIMATQETREQEIFKKAEAKLTKNLKAKQNAKVLSGGPAATGRPAGQTPAELKDTKKYGGLTSVLAERSAQRMRAA